MKITVKVSTGRQVDTNNYLNLYNKPSINGIVLIGDINPIDLRFTKEDVGLNNVDNTSDLDKPVSNATQSALNDKVSYEDMNFPIVTASRISREVDEFQIVQLIYNVSSLSTTEESVDVPLADESNSGLMSSADYTSLRLAIERITNLESKTTRLLYTAGTSPSAQEINDFVINLGYSSPFEGIAVVVDETYHIWHYYDNDGWKDDGVDTVSIFTNSIPGILLGSNEDGKIYAETDGTGSVKGWSALKTRVQNVENNKLSKSSVQNSAGSSTSDPISQNAFTVALAELLQSQNDMYDELNSKIPTITTTLKANGAYSLTINLNGGENA